MNRGIPIRLFRLFLWLHLTHSFATVRVLTFHCNVPQILEMQCKALTVFVLDDFELIVFNDAKDPYDENEIKRISEKYGAIHVRFRPEWHDYNFYLNEHFRTLMDKFPFVGHDQSSPSWRHSRMIQYGLDKYGYSHDDIVIILDGDAFPIRTISFQQILEDYDIAGTLRKGVNCEYFMPVFVAFDPRKLANPSEFQLHWDYFFDVYQDTGAYTYHYFQEHPEVKILKVPFVRGDQWLECPVTRDMALRDPRTNEVFNKLQGFYYELHMDGHILHLKGISHSSLQADRGQRISEFFEEILAEEFPPLRKIQVHPNAIVHFPGDHRDK